MKRQITIGARLALFVSLSACQLEGARDGNPPESPNAVFTYFVSQQMAVNDLDIAVNNSFFLGFPMAARKEISYAGLASPTASCTGAAEGLVFPDGARPLDIGDMGLAGYTVNEVTPFVKTQNLTFIFAKPLPPGEFEIVGEGIEGALQIRQPFKVLAASPLILMQSGDVDNTARRLPAPRVPAETDADYAMVVRKSQPLYVAYELPAGTSYVRLVINDWVKLPDGREAVDNTLQCYMPADQNTIAIPSELLNPFRTGEETTMAIDFVYAALDTTFTKIKESYVESYTRHVHGKVVMNGADKTQLVKRVGTLKFE